MKAAPFRALSLLGVAVTLVAFAALAPKALFVNGKKSAKTPIEQNGEIYIPASALSAAGADVAITPTRVSIQFKPVKTQNEQPYVEGVLGEWVTNGIWRIRVTNVTKIENPFGTGGTGFALDFEAKNTSSKMAQMAYSGVLGLQLLDSGDQRMANTSVSFKDYYSDIQPGGGFTNHIEFGADAPGGAEAKDAAKLIVQFDKPAKSIRIDLKAQ